MKCKRVISLFFVLLLTGCRASTELERGMALRSLLLKAEAVSFDARVTAEYEDRKGSFTLHCQFDNQGDMAFTVTEPESIAGIRGTVSQEGGRLLFEDNALFFELLTDKRISPVTAPWILMKTLRSGYITSVCTEGEQLRLTINDSYREDAQQLDIWCGEKDMPLRAEILSEGMRILTIEVKNPVIS